MKWQKAIGNTCNAWKIVLEISQFAWLPISVFRQTVYWFYASVRVLVCMCACVRERERGKRTLITLWNRTEYVTRSHEMSLNLKFGNWRYLHVSNLQVLLIILIFTAAAGKRPWSFCQKCRWQVTAKHIYTLCMWLCMKWHGAWLYGVHRTCWDGSSFMWHQPCQCCKYTTSVDIQKCAIKSYSLMQNHMLVQWVYLRAENSAR